MVIKVYVSGISASNEVKKRQQRALLILDSVQVPYELVDITEPGREDERLKLKQACKSSRPGQEIVPLPPQFFNEQLHCGDYEDFNLAVDADKLLKFLHIEEENTSVEDQPPERVDATRTHNVQDVENGIKEDYVSEDAPGHIHDENVDVPIPKQDVDDSLLLEEDAVQDLGEMEVENDD